jgi:hypothetical protein
MSDGSLACHFNHSGKGTDPGTRKSKPAGRSLEPYNPCSPDSHTWKCRTSGQEVSSSPQHANNHHVPAGSSQIGLSSLRFVNLCPIHLSTPLLGSPQPDIIIQVPAECPMKLLHPALPGVSWRAELLHCSGDLVKGLGPNPHAELASPGKQSTEQRTPHPLAPATRTLASLGQPA